MPYRFQRGEPVPAEVQRIAREQLQGAIDGLRGKRRRDEAIHEARKSIKKVRALMRLVKPGLGALYARENTRLRDAGRGLSTFRDDAAVIQTFDDLVDPRALPSIRRGLRLHKMRTEKQTDVKGAVQAIAAELDSTLSRVAKWPLSADGFDALGHGFEQTCRKGARAMAAVQKHPRAEGFHEWRKRVKDHWYHIRLLESVWPDMMAGHKKTLKDLEAWLGADHNLEVLRSKVTAEPEFYGAPADIETLLHLIGKRQRELRRRALESGERVYLEDPAAFRHRLHRLWDAWRK